jgi:NitT/TauT family transport system substrate-binding protein
MFRKLVPLFLLAIIISACVPVEPTQAPIPTVLVVTDTPAPTPTFETVHVKVAILPYITDSPFFFAYEEGYFAEQGLEVEFVRFDKPVDTLTPLLAGDLDATTVMPLPGLFNAIAGGGTMKIVAEKGYFDPTTCVYSGLVVTPETLSSGRLDDPANWVGLKISTERGAATEYAIDLLMQQNGMTIDDIEIVEMPIMSRQDALTNGAIDVAGAGEPWITRFSNAGAGAVWKGFNTLLPDFSFGAIAFGPTFLVEHPDVGQRFMVALLKGVAQYNEGKTPRNLEIIAQYTQLTTTEIEQTCWQMMHADGALNVQSVLDYQTWAEGRGLVTTPITAEQLYDPSFIEYAGEYLP